MELQLQDEWIDVESAPSGMAMGCAPRRDNLGDVFPVMERAIAPISRSRWEELAAKRTVMDQLIGRIHDQDGEGSCVGNGASKSFEIIYTLERGLDYSVDMSAMSLYKRIGRSAGSGANIGDALDEMAARGILPLDTPINRAKYKHVHPEVGFSKALPSGWEETAKQFRITEWWDIESFDGFVTALLLGFPVVYGRASHCICGLRPVLTKGVWYIKYVNSWGSWGDAGCGYDSESYLKARMGSYGAFAPRVTIVN